MTISGGDSVDSSAAQPVDMTALFQAVTLAPSSTTHSDPPVSSLFPLGEIIEGGGGPSGSLLPGEEDNINLYTLLCIESSEDVSAICGGQIAGTESRFCTRAGFPSANSCTTIKHRSHKHSLQAGHFYILKPPTSAFTNPSCPMNKLSLEQIHMFKIERKTMSQWQDLFTIVSNNDLTENTNVKEETDRKVEVLAKKLPLQTPARVKLEAKFKTDDSSQYGEPEGDRYEIPGNADNEWTNLPSSFKVFF